MNDKSAFPSKEHVFYQNMYFYHLRLPIFKQCICRRRWTNCKGRLKSFKYKWKM